MNLPDLIQSAIQNGNFSISIHARQRLRQRKISLWQVETGVDNWIVLEERPQDNPNPSIVCEQSLPDGAKIIVVWAWHLDNNQALLVTVYFPN